MEGNHLLSVSRDVSEKESSIGITIEFNNKDYCLCWKLLDVVGVCFLLFCFALFYFVFVFLVVVCVCVCVCVCVSEEEEGRRRRSGGGGGGGGGGD